MAQALPYWFILIFARPGNGKSLEQARMTEKVLLEYRKTEKKYPALPKRLLLTNQRLNALEFKKPLSSEFVNDHVIYWEEPEQFRYCPRQDCWKGIQLHRNHDVDLFIDEGSTLFPADRWADTPIWLRKMWAQHRHNGIRVVMLTQDFKAIDINVRRMVWQSYLIKKVLGSRDISPTLPPLHQWSITSPFGSVWGMYTKQRIDPRVMEDNGNFELALRMQGEEAKKAYEELKLIGGSEFHLITWHKINLYDTTQDVKEYDVKREIEHIEVDCKHENCGYKHRTHRLK